jgi:hypothetical protein
MHPTRAAKMKIFRHRRGGRTKSSSWLYPMEKLPGSSRVR